MAAEAVAVIKGLQILAVLLLLLSLDKKFIAYFLSNTKCTFVFYFDLNNIGCKFTMECL